MKIDINGVKITLTKEQLEEINKQVNTKPTINNINNYQDACKLLNINEEINPSIVKQIQIIARALNYIENGYKLWKINLNDKNQYLYYPYFTKGSGGLVFYYSRYHSADFNSSVAFCINEKVSNLLGTKFIHLYQQLENEY